MRVALFGCGWIQDFHARGVLAHGDELVVVANHREESARTFAERHAIPRVTTDWQAVAVDPGVDAVIVATPNALHAPQSIALLRNGKHVMVEKPMATSVAECDAMIEASVAGRASLMVAHCWRFRDEVIAMRDRIADGEFGEVVKTRGYGVHANWGPSGWFTDPALAGGGALVDMGVHAIDTVRFLLGNPEPTSVRATVGTRYAESRYVVDDDAIVLIRWSNGTNSVVESGWWQPHLGGLEADTEVYGTRGYARIWPPEAPSDSYEHCTQPMYTAQVGAFLDAIEAGRQPLPSGEDGRVVMCIVEEAYRDAEVGV
ncbi:MAG: Gfo/Idh/MocA family oxidoreductase [Actinomycetota bacterium]